MATAALYVSRPSLARVVRVEGFGPQVRGQGFYNTACSWPIKDPADLLDYVLDTSGAFFGVESDGIISLDVTIFPQEAQGLVLESSAVDGERAVMWLSGGVAGQTYVVTIGIGTAGGRYLLRGVTLPVQSLAPIVCSIANNLVDENGSPFIDQNGNYLVIS